MTSGRQSFFEPNKITIYDARDPTKLVQIQSSAVDMQSDLWVSSGASADWQFFRASWFSVRDGVGIMAVPLRFTNRQKANFDGYMLYDVSLTAGVSRRFSVSHVDADKYYDCYDDNVLADRVLFVTTNGTSTTIMTTKGHSILSANLQSGRRRWRLEIPSSSNRKCCFSWYTPMNTVCDLPFR